MAAITPEAVKSLREATGTGIMDCKNALVDAEGDIEKARQLLREKGLARANKRSSRSTSEGIVFSYIHPGDKVGVLLELNCETDFVAKTDEFKKLAREISMHIAAMSPLAILPEELPADVVEKEKEIYKNQAEQTGKPEKVIEKIASGRLEKFYKENCLLKQTYARDNTKTIEDIVKENVVKLGENIQVKRFSRFSIND